MRRRIHVTEAYLGEGSAQVSTRTCIQTNKTLLFRKKNNKRALIQTHTHTHTHTCINPNTHTERDTQTRTHVHLIRTHTHSYNDKYTRT